MTSSDYDRCVFINCPFDSDYKYLFDALVFTVMRCGFRPRCALEIQDGSQTRIDKILAIISESRFAIHDISRTELDATTDLPRFNMPLELGIFLGAKKYGNKRQRTKSCLVLEREKFLYQKYCSDISGQDPKAHDGDPKKAVTLVRNWLRTEGIEMNDSLRAPGDNLPPALITFIPGGSDMFESYQAFLRDGLPKLCKEFRLTAGELVFADFTQLCARWLKAPP